MKPIKFKEQNRTLQKPETMTDKECQPLPIFSDGIRCISLWKMSLRERVWSMFLGKVWLSVVSGDSQPPVYISCEKTMFVEAENET